MTKVWFKVKEVGVLMLDWVKTTWRSERFQIKGQKLSLSHHGATEQQRTERARRGACWVKCAQIMAA